MGILLGLSAALGYVSRHAVERRNQKLATDALVRLMTTPTFKATYPDDPAPESYERLLQAGADPNALSFKPERM